MTTTEFAQGKTWRWGVAWSFDETIKEKVNLVFYLSTCIMDTFCAYDSLLNYLHDNKKFVIKMY